MAVLWREGYPNYSHDLEEDDPSHVLRDHLEPENGKPATGECQLEIYMEGTPQVVERNGVWPPSYFILATTIRRASMH